MHDETLEQYQIFYEELPFTYVTRQSQALDDLPLDEGDASATGLSVDQVSQIAQDSIADAAADLSPPSELLEMGSEEEKAA